MKKIILLALGLLCTPAYADSTIDALSAAGALAGTESVPIFQTANPAVKATTGAIGNAGALTGDVTKSAGSGVTTLAAGSASNLNSGTLNAARMPALTGNCTTVAGAVATTCDLPSAGYSSSLWVMPYTGNGTLGANGTAPVASTIYCYYGAVAQKATIGNLGFAIQTAAASGNVQLALYTNVSSKPGTLLSSTTSQTTAATGEFTKALAANKQIGPGGTDAGRDIWFCTNVDASAGGTVKFMGPLNGTQISAAVLTGSATLADLVNRFGGNVLGYSCAGANCNGGSSTFGSWPASLAGSTWTAVTTGQFPLMAIQPASVP